GDEPACGEIPAGRFVRLLPAKSRLAYSRTRNRSLRRDSPRARRVDSPQVAVVGGRKKEKGKRRKEKGERKEVESAAGLGSLLPLFFLFFCGAGCPPFNSRSAPIPSLFSRWIRPSGRRTSSPSICGPSSRRFSIRSHAART